MYLCDVVKVIHSVDLALVLCGGDHLALYAFVIRDGKALAHGPRSHELGSMRVVHGILHKHKSVMLLRHSIGLPKLSL